MTRSRLAGAALAAAAVVFLLCEFVAAAAWRDPPYSYTYHYISDLGVRGPLEAMGQYMSSPLAPVMNTGFFLFGVLTLAGVALLDGLRGPRRAAVSVLGAVTGAGGIVLSLFPGDGESGYHGLGAVAAIAGGNLLVVALGSVHRHLGIPRRTGRIMMLLGAFGLVMLVVFGSVAGSGAGGLLGLVERCAVYPFLAGLIRAGVSIRRRRTDLADVPA